MPRKPRVRSRIAPRQPGSRDHRESQIFLQCQSCGAPVQPQFGVGDESWCPACHAVGTVAGMYGQYPSPPLYGAWAARQARQEEPASAQAHQLTEPLTRHRSLTNTKEDFMKRTKTHTGTFHCPSCFIEVELFNEESLKCDKCKGPLAEGSLDGIWMDEDEED
jgi:hypothetical protein